MRGPDFAALWRLGIPGPRMELAGAVISEAAVVGFGLVDGAVALPVLVTALELRHVDSEGACERWKRR